MKAAHNVNSSKGARASQSSYDLMPRMSRLMEAIAFRGIDGAALAPADRTIWETEVDQIIAHRMAAVGLVAAREAGFLEDDPIVDRLKAAHMRTSLRSSFVEGLAVAALGALERMKIPFVVTKGPGIARLYPDPQWRPFRDIDVLVHPRDFRIAMDVLETLDFAEPPSFLQPRKYFDRFCREGVNLLRSDGGAIDLHHHVPPWVWGSRIGPEAIMAAALDVETSGGSLRVAAPLHNLLVTALHVISDRGHGGHELLMWRDLATVAGACDPQAAAYEAHRTGLAWILAIVLQGLPENVRPASLLEALGSVEEPPGGRLRLRNLVPPARLARHQIARAFRYPLPNAVAFLIGFGLPSRSFLRQRYGNPLAYPKWWRDASAGLRKAAKSPSLGSRGPATTS